MRNSESQISRSQLHPVIQPYAFQMLDVGDGHVLYVEECGNPDGIPVVVLHGGPGGGCSPSMRRFFHPDIYRVILFDQRGCGRSTPHASIDANTTWHLVADIERIRKTLGIENWMVFGGSWGAALGLIYAQAYPEHVLHLILRGVFLMSDGELEWFYGGGAGQFFPEAWRNLIGLLPTAERDDVIGGYHARLFGDDELLATNFARAWTEWENRLATLRERVSYGSIPARYTRAFARIENHYFINHGFLSEDQQIMANMDKIASLPGTIVQGRYDMICPPHSAYKLHQAWPASELHMVAEAGHSLSEEGISSKLVEVMDHLA